MKFKYYLRGAGIGVIVATIILSAASLFQDNMSDAEVIQRAMELGMVMEEGSSGTLADIPGKGNDNANAPDGQDPGQTGDGDGADDGSDSPGNAGEGEPSDAGNDPGQSGDGNDTKGDASNPSSGGTGADGGSDSPENAGDGGASDTGKDPDGEGGGDKEDSKKDSEDGKKGDENDKIIVKVEGGDVSRAVSKKVFDAGLVDDVEEFNAYLGAHGYDNLLQPGTYHIKKGASFEQIAKILTSK